ncbi:BTAD domain-containing putative transcriptional regulator [Myceligenerans crystallogenes]|uniref:BTAD domain-containing putative transcriptional regulator n=1 Tax=Myceligenerans crystallogenes TaxID=316335 RepID=UPI0031CDAF1C
MGGTKQRATLGLLLLHANKVVATSKLLDALWASGEAPVTARKILHNAISGLRRALAHGDQAAGEELLVTRPPGYRIVADPEEVDLYVFYRLLGEGRAELKQGNPERAVGTLRQALDMWRGPVLCDLVETGISWPELAAVRNARLDAMEDYFEAAVACGREHDILRELEAMVEAEPQRERACAQLMIALYRTGRHADALEVYSRTRSALVDELGLDPSRDLQLLQRSILNHDPALAGGQVVTEAGPARAPVVREAVPDRGSVLLVRRQASPGAGPGQADRLMEDAAGLVRRAVHFFGGKPTVSFGSTSMAVFEAGTEDGAPCAVRAGWEIRRQLAAAGDRGARIAVATGTALVRSDPEMSGWLMVRGSAVDRCQDLLATAAEGEMVVCSDTRRDAGEQFLFARAPHTPAGWLVQGAAEEAGRRNLTPGAGESELSVVSCLLECARSRRRPHLVTVLGDPGGGKSRFLAEFEGRLAGQLQAVEFLVSYSLAGGLRVQGDAGPTRLAGVTARLEEIFREASLEQGSIARMRRLGKEFLAETTLDRPLVVIVDDLHRMPETFLDFVELLAGVSRGVPLLVVGAAGPELLRRRPEWNGGSPHSTTITLDPLSGAALDQLHVLRRRAWHIADRHLGVALGAGSRARVASGRAHLDG